MNRALIATLIVLASSLSSAWAYRVIEQPEDAYELMLGEVSLPRAVTGTVIFKPCEECNTASLRVTSETAYFINGTVFELPDFLDAAEEIRRLDGGNQNTAVYVFFDVASKRVTRIALDHFANTEQTFTAP